jgi:Tn3 transposase DDE domain-containing protein
VLELRRRSHVGLNEGEQQNALRRAVFFNRLGEIRDRSYESQRHRASGLNLLVAAITPSRGSNAFMPPSRHRLIFSNHLQLKMKFVVNHVLT